MNWSTLDTWIVVIGVLCAMACALPGNFLVLRRMSMMGDAISHAVLPGLAGAFLITGSRASLAMFVGAVVVGVLTALFTQWVHAFGKVDSGASMGVVFTTLFAIGLIMIVRAADHVDLDPGCVLYGAIDLAPLDTVTLGGVEVPRAAAVLGGVLLFNLLFVALFFKELKISSFDPNLATTLGINARLMHYLLMTVVAVTTVAAFETIGSILVIAMLIVPAAAAHLLTDRLGSMIAVSLLFAAVSAVLGHIAAIVVPGWIGFEGTNTSGSMATVAGALFFLVMLGAPRHGVLSKVYHRVSLSLRIVGEDLLGLLYRLDELGPASTARGPVSLHRALGINAFTGAWVLRRLASRGKVVLDGGAYKLTEPGRREALELVRSHRLWETFLAKHLGLPADHVHVTAERLEHVTGAAMSERLAEASEHPTHDPHGKRVPGPGTGVV